jgi:hypothetical protein
LAYCKGECLVLSADKDNAKGASRQASPLLLIPMPLGHHPDELGSSSLPSGLFAKKASELGRDL